MKIIKLVTFLILVFLSVSIKANDGVGNFKNKIFYEEIYAPEFSLKDLKDKTVRLSDFSNKVILLNFWATWCGPCRDEIPGLKNLYANYGDKGFVVIGIILADTKSNVSSYVDSNNINYPVLMGDNVVSAAYGPYDGDEDPTDIMYIPTTFIISSDRKIIQSYIGKREEKFFEEEILKLIPKIASTIPAIDAIHISIETNIEVNFFAPMDTTTITALSFLLKDKKNNSKIDGIVSCPNSKKAVLHPLQNLNFFTEYKATITESVKDLEGNPIPYEYSWNFTTNDVLDTTPPTVISTDPSDGAKDIDLVKNITATFSELIDNSTFNESTFYINDSNNNKVNGKITLNGTIAKFIPAEPFKENITYTATITNTVKDYSGNKMKEKYTWSYTTLGDAKDAKKNKKCFISNIVPKNFSIRLLTVLTKIRDNLNSSGKEFIDFYYKISPKIINLWR